MGIFSKLFMSSNARELAKIEKIVDKVESFKPKMEAMSDEELRGCTQIYKDRVAAGEKLEDILPEAFATVREASKRVLNMEHYRVQLIGGVVLFQGRIAEMRTGEGKTLVATLAAYVAALEGKGVHVVTVNEYLAKRDAEWMGKIYKFLGLTVGINLAQASPDYKRAQYNCDIMYTTNNELGFDYLRDNMVTDKSQKVQRGLHFAIVDEVDSILIDEARTPLIISGQGTKSADTYITANRFVKTLNEEDYELDEKEKTIFLNENGAVKAEKYFNVENLADYENQELKHYIDNALKANFIMKKEDNYIVIDNEIVIVDEFTGRQMIGRRYSNGLHQAIEAKENVPIRSENKTLATITFQNLFRLYPKLSGMTGTAMTEKTEFETIYYLDIVEIPTNKPVQRIDRNDQLYTTKKGKYAAVLRDVISCYEKGQPVLIGTVSIDKSEELDVLLKKNKIPHNVLNAKNHEKEAEIVAQAGKFKAVTIATNMAGRGTDILLGGNPEFLTKEKLANSGYSHEAIELGSSMAPIAEDNKDALKAREDYKKYYELFKQDTDKEKEEVIKVGGLKIIGTERHESRRIDNQLRGRAGRQGDPGESIFYLSMEDDVMRIFGGEQMKSICDRLAVDENTPIEAKIITNQIRNAQAAVEDRNFSIRKHVIGYDDVMNEQRKIIYEQRNIVLDGMDVHEQIKAMMKDVIAEIVHKYVDYKVYHVEWNYEGFNKELEENILANGTNLMNPDYVEKYDTEEEITNGIYEVALSQYEEKIKKVDSTMKEDAINNIKNASNIPQEEKDKILEQINGLNMNFGMYERDCLLRNVDRNWMDHIDNMDQLKQGISLVAYGHQDPVQVYKQEGYEMFEAMNQKIQEDVVKALCKGEFAGRLNIGLKRPVQPTKIKTNKDEQAGMPIKVAKKPGRNDPCPCGSGKKYKDCCGR